MTAEQAIELLTSYRNNWIDSDFFNLAEIDAARDVVRANGYEWQQDNDGWKLIKTSN